MRNGIIESFNGRLRDECFNTHGFPNLPHARLSVAAWGSPYNQWRPHSALGYRTPNEFANRVLAVPLGSYFGGTSQECLDGPPACGGRNRESLCDK